ncbi:hypothetical protein [Thiothrix nivea]|uniref:Cobalamin ABC transporter n=1 Tax=Thiothrix nivea (strain ATCC 35100 / DSM 5205 / JP2) TaxID=870187 RepID=A0A656HFE0_THINJ|nr:hypothetical protein [Thiothrix nivea]EIJ34912.1 hypothetical protein Thini_2358 [Thiothrix nivea DSM 5205]
MSALLSTKQQWLVGGILLLVMLATRIHVSNHLQDASWAIFFLAGFYLRHWLSFGVFMAAAVLIDYIAISQMGVSSFCVTDAYVALVPAYGALYAAGRWFGGLYRESLSALLPLAASLLVGVVACEVISSGSFYLLSPRFAEAGISGFAQDLVKYLPHSLAITGFYVGVAALVHIGMLHMRRPQGHVGV